MDVTPVFLDGGDGGGIMDGERAKEYGVNDGEDGRVGSDADGQGENGDDGEAGRFEEDAETVAKVLKECVHELIASLIRVRGRRKETHAEARSVAT